MSAANSQQPIAKSQPDATWYVTAIVARLTEKQFDHVCLHLSICFKTTPAEIGHDMRTRGMPLVVDANLVPPAISMRMVI